MDTILKGTAATIAVTFQVDGTATNPSPDSATVQVLRDDGTELVASTPATDAGVGKFTYTLTPAHTVRVDVLTARWTATVSGQAQTLETKVEIVGAFIVSLAAIDAAVPPAKTADELAEARTWAETALEDACGVAFRARYARETMGADGTTDLLLNRTGIQSLIAATVDDVALTSTQLAAVEVAPSGLIYWAEGWSSGRQNVTISYIYGARYCPPRVARAVIRLARSYLLEDPTNLDERATSISTEDATYSLVTAGVRGAPFSIPEVNQVVQEYGKVGIGVG